MCVRILEYAHVCAKHKRPRRYSMSYAHSHWLHAHSHGLSVCTTCSPRCTTCSPRPSHSRHPREKERERERETTGPFEVVLPRSPRVLANRGYFGHTPHVILTFISGVATLMYIPPAATREKESERGEHRERETVMDIEPDTAPAQTHTSWHVTTRQ